MKRLYSLLIILSFTLPFSLSCTNVFDAITLLYIWLNGKDATAPVLNNLVITDTQSDSITLAQPALSTAGDPAPKINAYIGLNGTITISGEIVSNYVNGPIDVSASGYEFIGLTAATSYKIIVVARNALNYSVQQIVQSTAGASVAPVLNSLSISAYDDGSITLAHPTLSTTGYPTPTVQAYIGLDGTISYSGSTVTGSVQGPIDVSAEGCQFNGLNYSTSYKIIVVAKNSVGYNVAQIIQSTAGLLVKPVLNSLSISTYDDVSISIAKPTFSTAGSPTPTVQAYIGLTGTISFSGSSVSNSLQGPIDVSTGGCQFTSLSSSTSYTIIVVAKNSAGYSVVQIAQSTAGTTVKPVLNNLSVSVFDDDSITIAKPTFSTAGNPTPTVQAYIGLTGTIASSGSTVSNSIQGPIDVSTGGYQFSSLSGYTSYTIIVVAKNIAGYSVMQIVQSTAGITPVLNSLSVSAFDDDSITIAKPTFSIAGNPTPTVKAYIGLSSTISISGTTVTGSLQGPIDVSTGAYQFSSLSALTSYKVIVVAQNAVGSSAVSITQSTAGIAPILNSLSVSAFDGSSVTIAKPTFSVAGNPAPTVKAYIGLTGTISVSGSTVTGSVQGPIDVSTGAYQFTGLNPLTSYTVIVVAANAYGPSVKQVAQSTSMASGMYAVGFYTVSGNSQACYWINGIKYDLPGTTPSIAYMVAFGDSEFYVTGQYTVSGETKACYWVINGSGTTRIDLSGTLPSSSSGVIKYGNALYIGGNQNFDIAALQSGPCYWKIDLSTGTATRTDLSTSGTFGGMATQIALTSSGEVNVSGTRVTYSLTAEPGYWKISGTTNTWNAMATSGNFAAAMTIYASGSDIYLGGADEYDFTTTSMRATYWKSSGSTKTKVSLASSATGSYVAGMSSLGSNVYASGQINTRTACYWINAARTDLPGASSSTYSAANCLFVTSNGDLYLSGYYNGSSTTDILGRSGGVACYWKATGGANPVKFDLPGAAPSSAIRMVVR
jgi:hypothetical protein